MPIDKLLLTEFRRCLSRKNRKKYIEEKKSRKKRKKYRGKENVCKHPVHRKISFKVEQNGETIKRRLFALTVRKIFEK